MRLRSSAVAKVTAAVLFVICIFMTILDIMGIAVFYYDGVYRDEGRQLRRDVVNNIENIYRDELEYYFRKIVFYEESEEDSGIYDVFGNDSNYLFTLKKEDTVLATNMENANYEVYEEKEYIFLEEFVLEEQDGGAKYVYTGALRKELVQKDFAYHHLKVAEWLISMRYAMIGAAVMLVIASIILYIFLNCAAGHKKGHEGIYLNEIDKIPFDLYVTANLLIVMVMLWFIEDIYDIEQIIIIGAFCIMLAVMTVLLIMTFATRIKSKTLIKNTLIYRGLGYFKRGLVLAKKVVFKLPLYWKAALVWCGISAIELLFLTYGREYVMLWMLEKMIFTPLIIVVVLNLKKLEKTGKELARGNINYKTNLEYMLPSFKGHGKNLNDIGIGLQKAVGESVKSERMKAELITNVSHDIKTPLTSIVSYVDLLKKDGLNSEKAPEYVEVLERQSARLKKLTEDLIEASKASTGNIKVNKAAVDVNVLLTQALGEYEIKLLDRDLKIVTNLSEIPLNIEADGSLLWRVFDNLLGNICKYAKQDTRVYVMTKKEENDISITFKNISNEELNVSSDELMERFVRGDASRNTEGSGLGLSIAKSLIELQGGVFDIDIDGDLFKTIIKFRENR